LRQGRSDEFEGLRSGRDNETAGFPPQARDGFFASAEAVDRNDDGSEIENPPAEAVGRNDELNQLGNEFHHLDFVVSNPPYVGLDEADKVQRSVKEFEPGVAVFAGEHGLDVIRPLVEQAHQALKPGGWLAMEIGYSMRDEVLRLLTPTMWDDTRVVPDLQGIPRVIAARKKSV
jgi:methylase of polypeptide subunit release factors